MIPHACNPSTQGVEAEGSMISYMASLSPAWATRAVVYVYSCIAQWREDSLLPRGGWRIRRLFVTEQTDAQSREVMERYSTSKGPTGQQVDEWLTEQDEDCKAILEGLEPS